MRTHYGRLLAVTALLGCPASSPDEEDSQTDTAVTGSPTSAITATTEPGTSSTSSDPDSSTSGPDESEGSSGEPLDACGVGRVCLGPPPLGWVGPVVLAKADVADALPSCVDPYPGNEITRLEGYVDPGPAECECNCALNAAGCIMYTYTGSAGSCGSFAMGTEGCFAMPTPATGALQVYSFPNGAAACDQSASENIPEIPWEAVVKGCTGGYSDESCDDTDGICYARPADGFESQICYLSEGDIPCPPGTDFMEKTLRYSAVDDTRECTNCTCGTLSYCLDEYEYFTTSDCSGAAAGSIGNGVCQSGVNAAAVNFDFEGASCPVTSMSEPEGTVTPLDPWTYCCATL